MTRKTSPLLTVLLLTAMTGCNNHDQGKSMKIKFDNSSTMTIYESSERHLQVPPEIVSQFVSDLNEATLTINEYENAGPAAFYLIVLGEHEFPIYVISEVDFIDLKVSDNTRHRYQHPNFAMFRSIVLTAIDNDEGFDAVEVKQAQQKYLVGRRKGGEKGGEKEEKRG